ncbi:MAG: twin-arginine translocase TatA/TatE family subunit [Bacteroidia bacterium]|nr:twin-arginine translocase TatA/TatE family subunit [Bacteroidia bacterium]
MIQSIFLAMLGTTEIIIIAAIILLLFGGSKLPKLMKGLGQGMNEFKKGMKEGDTSQKTDEEGKSTEDKS